jgi:hypothetical protein
MLYKNVATLMTTVLIMNEQHNNAIGFHQQHTAVLSVT